MAKCEFSNYQEQGRKSPANFGCANSTPAVNDRAANLE